MRVRVAISGFGNVGRALARVLASKSEYIRGKFDVEVSVVGVVDSRGAAVNTEGFAKFELLKLTEMPRSGVSLFKPYGVESADLNYVLEKAKPDIVVEVTPPNYDTGEPGLTNILSSLKAGAHVVTANKAPLALRFDEVMGEARRRGLEVRFRATVMGGTPFIDTLMSIRSAKIERVEGVFNATTNFILTEMEDKVVDFYEALRYAQLIGVAEPDPSLDIDGIDPAAKIVIVSNLIGRPLKLRDVRRVSLRTVSLSDILQAVRRGHTVRYVAFVDAVKGEAAVEPREVPSNCVLALARGIMNVARVVLDTGELVFMGRGGGPVETAHSILDDIVGIALSAKR